jgi:hypothetical protein
VQHVKIVLENAQVDRVGQQGHFAVEEQPGHVREDQIAAVVAPDCVVF